MSTEPMNRIEIVLGLDLVRDGHHQDGHGFGIEPNVQYNVEYIRYTEVVCIWRVGIRKPERK